MPDVSASVETIAVMLLLLPGFVTLLVERSFAYQREPSAPLLVAKALVYSLVNYAVFSFFGLPLVAWRQYTLESGALALDISDTARSACLVLAIGSVTGLLVGVLKAHDLHMTIARLARLTHRTAKDNVWLDVIERYDSRVLVGLGGDRRAAGYPEHYADEFATGPVLFLTRAEWIGGHDERIPVPDPGLMINGSEIEYIQLYDEKGQKG